MALAFSSPEDDAIGRKIELNNRINPEPYIIYEFYEIPRCIEWIETNSFLKVALQFPDNLLKDATEVAVTLKKQTEAKVYVLGDTSYGSCCVDEVAAQHVSADAIIHFGHACLSPTNRLPVLYVFGKFPIDVGNVLHEFRKFFVEKESDVLVFCDVFYIHAMGQLKTSLESEYKNLIFLEHDCLQKEDDAPDAEGDREPAFVKKCGRMYCIPDTKSLSSYSMFYIGSEQRTLMNIMLSFKCLKYFSYDPITKTAKPETLDINKYLRKRYYCIEKAKDAKIIGILVGTLGVCNYLSVIDHLRTLAKSSGKKTYTLVVGKLNTAKLANFPEIDVFVYVSCPESSVVDSHDFYQPIVTPFEMEIACNQARVWTGDYITDFAELLPGASSHVPLSPVQSEVGDVSLVTGKLRSLGYKPDDHDENSDKDILLRDNMTIASIHAGAAGEHLAGRCWQGLERRLGETPVSKVVQGKTGIASGYGGEGNRAT